MKNLKYNKLEIQKYFLPSSYKTSPLTTKFIFQARTRMLNLKLNFKNTNQTDICDLCGQHSDNQEQLLTRPALSSDQDLVNEQLVYNDLFNTEYEKILTIAQVLKCKYDIRNKILNIRKKSQ